MVVVGDASSPFFTDRESGVLAQFRHRHFLLFLIPHFQKAALLMFASRLVNALKALEVGDPESVKQFKRAIRQNFEIFLRFTHRYWFHEVADQAQAKALYHLVNGHSPCRPTVPGGKGAHVRHERIPRQRQPAPPGQYRGQAHRGDGVRLDRHNHHWLLRHEHSLRGLLGTGDFAFVYKLLFFVGILAGTVLLLVLTMSRSKRLSDFLDMLSDDRLPVKAKFNAFWRVWISEKSPTTP